MELVVESIMIDLVFHFCTAHVSLAGEKRASKAVEGNDSLDEEAGFMLALILSWKGRDKPVYDRHIIHFQHVHRFVCAMMQIDKCW